ncbi:putative K(+)/H(+) antiporter subunit A/B [Allostella sp. ATCC 35155]|nr:putative K(+)/H(+) antiporter subunit A/B [Stella sp. ATCC 35155]
MMSDESLLALVLALPFAGSLVVGFLPSNRHNLEAWLAGAIALAGLAIALALYPAVADGKAIRVAVEWLPTLGLDFTLRMDGFAWLFTVLVTGIGLLVVLYARYYMSPDDPVARFFAFLLGFMGAMLGIVLSGNLIQLVFFWELTSLSSFLLIGYWHHTAKARDGARMALTVTASGGLCLFVGVVIVGHIVGSYDLDRVLESGAAIRSHALYVPALVLILLGALTKSAQFPFHFWLPQAMAAPTPVSAYLHSATMVKAGVFLMVRLWPALGYTEAWFWIVGTAGLCTFVLGAYLAMFQQDLKGLLAYSTISHLGLITLLIGLDSPTGIVAAIFHMMNHATFKASLFMAAGIIDHETGTRDIRRLSGLLRLMPVTAGLAILAAASMAGVPLLNGFLSKEMFFAEAVAHHSSSAFDRVLPYLAALAAMFSVTYSLRFIHGAFFGPPPADLPRQPPPLPSWMAAPVALLVSACVLVGMFPAVTAGPFLDSAARGVLGAHIPTYSLAVWHGFNVPLLMSVVAMAGGALLYLALQRYLSSGIEGSPLLRRLDSQRIFDRIMIALTLRAGRIGLETAGTRRLQPQLRLILGVACAAALWPLLQLGMAAGPLAPSALDPALTLVWVVGAACAIAAAYQAKYHRFAALILTGGAGLVVCVTFAWLSAPDLALTQLLVEIVTTVLLLLGLRWLPKREEMVEADRHRTPRVLLRRAADLAIATVVGIGVAAIAYAVMTRPAPDSRASFFVERAYTEGGGTNVVNVILVDFRGFDTLGEIAVLGVVALTVYALLRRFRPAPDSIVSPEQQVRQNARAAAAGPRQPADALADSLLVPALVMRLLFPVIGMVAVYLFLRGHDLPGGGFVAGLTMSVAFILQYMAGGTRWVEARLIILPVRWIGVGLLLAALTGLGAWAFGYPFLTSHASHPTLPVVGKVPLASAILFDLGVFVLVVGATVLILIALAHQSIRTHRPTKPEPAPDHA